MERTGAADAGTRRRQRDCGDGTRGQDASARRSGPRGVNFVDGGKAPDAPR